VKKEYESPKELRRVGEQAQPYFEEFLKTLCEKKEVPFSTVHLDPVMSLDRLKQKMEEKKEGISPLAVYDINRATITLTPEQKDKVPSLYLGMGMWSEIYGVSSQLVVGEDITDFPCLVWHLGLKCPQLDKYMQEKKEKIWGNWVVELRITTPPILKLVNDYSSAFSTLTLATVLPKKCVCCGKSM